MTNIADFYYEAAILGQIYKKELNQSSLRRDILYEKFNYINICLTKDESNSFY